jgi:hypothetical protein
MTPLIPSSTGKSRDRTANATIATVACLTVLVAVYASQYFSHPVLPGKSLIHPEGWWGWLDQGNYLKSARAFAIASFSPDAHWFPLGYSLLAVPFVRVAQNHAFFFPDCVCFATTAVLWERLARIFKFPVLIAWALFAGSLLIDPRLFEAFVIPWNTTSVAAYVYFALYLVIRKPGFSPLIMALCGACAALVLVTRPSDVFLFIPISMAMLFRLITEHDWRSASSLACVVGAVFAAIVFAFLMLHLFIYGPQLSAYMSYSRAVGFDFRPLAEKLYAFFIDPIPLYGQGEAILHRSPWLLLAPFGLITICWHFAWRGVLLTAVVLVNVITYTAYVDLDPISIFKYGNIHYFKLSFPILLLAVTYGLLAVWRNWRLVPLAVTIPLTILMLRYEVVAVPANAVIINQKQLSLACSDCVPVNSIVLYPAEISGDEASLASTYVQVGETRLRSLLQFRLKRVGDALVMVFPETIATNGITLIFDLPGGHGYSPQCPPRVTVGHGAFGFSGPRLP